MKKCIYCIAIFALLAAMGCGNSTIRSAEIYLQQNDPANARRVINENLPLLSGSTKAEAYYMLVKMTDNEIVALNTQAKKAQSAKEKDQKLIAELLEKRIDKFTQLNSEINFCIQSSNTYAGVLDTLREAHWIEYFNSGVSPFKAKKWNDAINAFKLAWSVDSIKSSHKDPARLIGEVLLQQNANSEEALSWFHRAIAAEDKDKMDFLSRAGIANYFYSNEKWTDALNGYNTVLAIPAPANPRSEADSARLESYINIRNQSIANKAICLDRLDRKKEAAECYEQALKVDSQNSVLWFNLGQRYFSANEYEKAESALMNVLKIETADTDLIVDTKYVLALTKFQKKDFVEAEKLLQAYLVVKSDNKSAWVTLTGAIANQFLVLDEKKDAAKRAELQKRLTAVQEEMKKRGFGE